ncbi:hypothetical protein KDJ21_007695 [Metabacillus litoralis]|uniref:hypothetical protein n=1 Tax=Metabacillus TaxID=2675233 RepID=UPI001B9B0A1F|nr:hypothetical protein [Metabacillus litoralis]UHA61526.1 hypothetical protein KDJ21_007695 [Metabacillus litoralis]
MRMLAVLFLLTSIFLAGCGTDVKQSENGSTEENTIEENETTEATEEVNETEEPQEETAEVTQEAEGEEATEEPAVDSEQVSTESLEGVYNGQVDTHSIEVDHADHGPMIFQTLETEVDFDSIKEGSNVTLEYYVDENGLNVLKTITVVN